ncbi:hypothetical protein KPL74_13610 [Bacillus sp. NP157]|nr:hypothetical protein KPL74_13610 [Bacillus sp. NP157]
MASLYARPRPWLFLGMAPAVVGSLIILTPFAFLGLLLVVPGVCGFLGLIGIAMAWIGLANPGLVERKGALIALLLVGSLPAVGLGAVMFMMKVEPYQTHAVDPMRSAGLAAIGFGVLVVFFLPALIPGRAALARAPEKKVAAWVYAGTLVAVLGAVVPAGYVLGLAGYGSHIRAEQAAQADELSLAALNAVDTYRADHDGELPADNRAAGLPAADAMRSRYVASVRVEHGSVTLVYAANRMAELFGAGAADVVLTFSPATAFNKGVVRTEGGAWTCQAMAFRYEGDVPLLLGGRCKN